MFARTARSRKLSVPLAFIVVVAVFSEIPTGAAAYSCPIHCYGYAEWKGGVDGSNVNISVQTLFDNDSNAHINNEMWLLDTLHYASGNPYFASWMEIGMMGTGGTTYYFWAQIRLQDTSLYTQFLIDVPSGDYGTSPYFELQRDTASQFHLIIRSNGYNFNGYSFANSMQPNLIQIGQELSGSHSAIALPAHWTKSQYVASGGVHVYQFRPADTTHSDSPLKATWITVPAPGNNGGNFQSECYNATHPYYC